MIRTSRRSKSVKLVPKPEQYLSADFVEESKIKPRPGRRLCSTHIINAAGSRGAQGEAQEAHVVRSGVQAHSCQGRAAAPTAEPHQAHLRSLPGHRALPGGLQPPFRTRSGGGRASRAAAVPSLEDGPSARSPAPPPRASTSLGVVAPTLDERLKPHWALRTLGPEARHAPPAH